VFVDPLDVLHPFPLIGGQHIIYYSNSNKTDLFAKLDHYRRHPEEARRIAINGYLHAMKYHRTVSMVDYIMRSVHLKQATLSSNNSSSPFSPLPHYEYTAQELNRQGRIIQKATKLKKATLVEKQELIKFG
jgi:hypothetical protein